MRELAALICKFNQLDPQEDMSDVYVVNDTQFGDNTVEIDGDILIVRIDLKNP